MFLRIATIFFRHMPLASAADADLASYISSRLYSATAGDSWQAGDAADASAAADSADSASARTRDSRGEPVTLVHSAACPAVFTARTSSGHSPGTQSTPRSTARSFAGAGPALGNKGHASSATDAKAEAAAAVEAANWYAWLSAGGDGAGDGDGDADAEAAAETRRLRRAYGAWAASHAEAAAREHEDRALALSRAQDTAYTRTAIPAPVSTSAQGTAVVGRAVSGQSGASASASANNAAFVKTSAGGLEGFTRMLSAMKTAPRPTTAASATPTLLSAHPSRAPSQAQAQATTVAGAGFARRVPASATAATGSSSVSRTSSGASGWDPLGAGVTVGAREHSTRAAAVVPASHRSASHRAAAHRAAAAHAHGRAGAGLGVESDDGDDDSDEDGDRDRRNRSVSAVAGSKPDRLSPGAVAETPSGLALQLHTHHPRRLEDMEAAAQAEADEYSKREAAAAAAAVGAAAAAADARGGKHALERDLTNDLAVLHMVMNPEQSLLDDKELLSLGE